MNLTTYGELWRGYLLGSGVFFFVLLISSASTVLCFISKPLWHFIGLVIPLRHDYVLWHWNKTGLVIFYLMDVQLFSQRRVAQVIEFAWYEYDWILACFLKNKMYFVSSNQGRLHIACLEKGTFIHCPLERTEMVFLIVNGTSLCDRQKVWICELLLFTALNVVKEKLAIMQYGFHYPILRSMGIRNGRWNFGQQGVESFCGCIRNLPNSLHTIKAMGRDLVMLKWLWSLDLRSREGRSSSSPQLLTLWSFF